MPLLDFWQNNKDTVTSMTLPQIVTMAGDGNLKDDSECSIELIKYFSHVEIEILEKYIKECLSKGFQNSGLVLQDLVNELGRRLDYKVQNGLYQGRSNKIGFDGIWRLDDGSAIVIEVKTTDAYRMSLDTINRYKESLIENCQISENSSVLIIVGREDTGELEAQVRGSRHAWGIRLLGIESLIKLVKLKTISEEDTANKIRQMLIPMEYTKLDSLYVVKTF